MEWDDQVQFPREVRRAMEELQMIFLVDSKDDSRFRAGKNEISELLAEVERLRSTVNERGLDGVVQDERALEEEQERRQRRKYIVKRERRED